MKLDAYDKSSVIKLFFFGETTHLVFPVPTPKTHDPEHQDRLQQKHCEHRPPPAKKFIHEKESVGSFTHTHTHTHAVKKNEEVPPFIGRAYKLRSGRREITIHKNFVYLRDGSTYARPRKLWAREKRVGDAGCSESWFLVKTKVRSRREYVGMELYDGIKPKNCWQVDAKKCQNVPKMGKIVK